MKIKKITVIIIVFALCFAASAVYYVPVNAEGSAGEVYSRSHDTKKIALTFDDGPHPKYTEHILDLLDEHDIKATFFVIGCNAKQYEQFVKRAAKDGHEIGNHTFSHPHMKELSYEEISREISATEQTVFEMTGKRTRLFRPPEGKCSPELKRYCKEKGYSIILWSVDTTDWNSNPSENIVKEVMHDTHGGDIILFHDYVSGQNTTIDALKILIPKLKKSGYEFVTVSELMNENK